MGKAIKLGGPIDLRSDATEWLYIDRRGIDVLSQRTACGVTNVRLTKRTLQRILRAMRSRRKGAGG